MTISHHLDDTTILRYASGDLDAAFIVVVATHLARCAECRSAVRLAEQAGGHLLDDLEAAPLADGGFAKMMARIDRLAGDQPQPKPQPPAHEGDIPLPLQAYLGPYIADIKWRRVAPGVKKCTLTPKGNTRSKLYLLNIGPGMAMPEHGHGGAELTYILSGAYRDAMGIFGPGDVADLDEHIEHQPRVEPDAPCICLVATEAPTRFKDIFSRMLQPLIGI